MAETTRLVAMESILSPWRVKNVDADKYDDMRQAVLASLPVRKVRRNAVIRVAQNGSNQPTVTFKLPVAWPPDLRVVVGLEIGSRTAGFGE